MLRPYPLPENHLLSCTVGMPSANHNFLKRRSKIQQQPHLIRTNTRTNISSIAHVNKAHRHDNIRLIYLPPYPPYIILLILAQLIPCMPSIMQLLKMRIKKTPTTTLRINAEKNMADRNNITSLSQLTHKH